MAEDAPSLWSPGNSITMTETPMQFAPSTGDEHLATSSALAAKAAGGLGFTDTGVPLLLPMPTQQQSPLSCVWHLPVTCSNFAVATLIKAVFCLYQQQGLS